jgi:hypothetical protein
MEDDGLACRVKISTAGGFQAQRWMILQDFGRRRARCPGLDDFAAIKLLGPPRQRKPNDPKSAFGIRNRQNQPKKLPIAARKIPF